MTIAQFRKQHGPALRAFLETADGRAFTQAISALDPARQIKGNTPDNDLVNHSVPMVAKIAEFNSLLGNILLMSKPMKPAAKRKPFPGKNIPRPDAKSNQPSE